MPCLNPAPPQLWATYCYYSNLIEGHNTHPRDIDRALADDAAAHHRLLWIHPFYDGNGRVARLFVHAYLRDIGVGSSLWSVSRGLARNVAQYQALLMAADQQRDNDWDGPGN
jgi:Fic family protein